MKMNGGGREEGSSRLRKWLIPASQRRREHLRKHKISETEDGKKGYDFSQCPVDWVMEKGERKKKKIQFVKAFLFVSKLCPFPLSQSMLFWLSYPLCCCFKVAEKIKGQRQPKFEA